MKFLLPKPVKTLRKNVPPTVMTNEYLYHEFLKIFSDIKKPAFHRQIKKSVNSLLKRYGPHNYWLLVSAIAEGWRVKQIYRLLTNPGYQWNLELRKISDLSMTGFNPRAVDRLIFRCHRKFERFADYYRHHPEFFKKYMPNLHPRPGVDKLAVFAYWNTRENRLQIFDGMRRTVLATIARKKTIKTFVGYPLRQGKPMVNLDKIQFYKLLAAFAKKDKKTINSFVVVGREIVKQHSNARRAFINSIKPWSDPFSKKLMYAITKK
jgi:hypothetical protein